MVRPVVAALALLSLVAPPGGEFAGDDRQTMDLVLPEPGTSELHRIMRAQDGPALSVIGSTEKLSRFTSGRITLLGFIYTSCTDPQGCPMAYRVFDRLKDEIRGAPALKDEVQLVTLSFDPARDSPSAMKRYAGSH